MLTIGFITIVFVLLPVVLVFALMAKDSNRRGQSVSLGTPEVRNRGGRRGLIRGYLPAATVGAGCQVTPVSVMVMARGPSAPSFRKGPSDLWSWWVLSV